MSSIMSNTYDPPSGELEVDLLIDQLPPTAYEIECVWRLRKLLLPIQQSVHEALAQLNQWRPSWTNHRDSLQGLYDDANKTLLLMKIHCEQENGRFELAMRDAQFLQGSLPNENEGKGTWSPETDSQHIAYRKKSAEEREKDARNHRRKVNQLENDMNVQRKALKEICMDLNPALQVMSQFNSVYESFSAMKETLDVGYQQLIRRVPTPAQAMPNDLWSRIFQLVVQKQQEDNRLIMSTGTSFKGIQCPRGVATTIALVCKQWGNIMKHDQYSLGDSWLVDLSRQSPSSFHLSPINTKLDTNHATVVTSITRDTKLLTDNTRQLTKRIKEAKISRLDVVYFPNHQFIQLLKACAKEGNLKSLSIYGDVDSNNPQIAIPGAVFQPLRWLDVINCGIKPKSLYVSGNQLRFLRIFHSKPQAPGTIMSSLDIYHLLAPLKQLEELEFDFGTEDISQSVAVNYPPVPDMLLHLRSLKTRLTYFLNRLAFLRLLDLPLPKLSSITLVTIPEFSFKDQWDLMAKIFTSGSLANTVTQLTVEDTTRTNPDPRRTYRAGLIITYLRRLETLDLQRGSVDHFLEYLCHYTRQPDLPILTCLNELHIRDSDTSGVKLLEFIRLYRGDLMPGRPRGSSENQSPFSSNSSPLRVVETYRCGGISIDTLKRITDIVPGRLLNS